MPPGLAVAVPPGLMPTSPSVPLPLSKALQLPVPPVGPSYGCVGDASVESSPETVEMGGNLGLHPVDKSIGLFFSELIEEFHRSDTVSDRSCQKKGLLSKLFPFFCSWIARKSLVAQHV